MCIRDRVQERRLLAESGQISYASLLPVIEHLTEESSYLVVSAVSSVLAGISLFVDEGTETEDVYKRQPLRGFCPLCYDPANCYLYDDR